MGSSPAPYIANLHLFTKEREFIQNNQNLFENAFVTRYLDDILSIGIDYHSIAPDIYGPKLPFTLDLPKDNTLNFLDIKLSWQTNSTKFQYETYDKRADYGFSINRFPHHSSLIHSKTLIGVGISQLIRFHRTNSSLKSFIHQSKIYLKDLADSGAPD